ncbi:MULTISPECIES: hypothetical protein [Xenorhabdus]|nr:MULTISPECIES: hypothetical protein [Xenorhabdus]
MRKILGITPAADLGIWMKREKTEGALRIASSEITIVAPAYIQEAVKFIYE